MRKLIIGVLLGGILLSGGWFAYGAISQEVGINMYDTATTTWKKIKSVTMGGALTVNSTDQLSAVTYPHMRAASAAATWVPAVGAEDVTLNDENALAVFLYGRDNANEANAQKLLAYDSDTTSDTPAAGSFLLGTKTLFQVLNGTVYYGVGGQTTIAISPAVSNPTVNVSSFSYEQQANLQSVRVHSSYGQTTTGITTNAAGTAVNMLETPMLNYTLIIDRTVGATDVVAINLECSYDGTIWPGTTQSLIQVTTLATEPTRNSVSGTPCNYMRYNVLTVGAGNTLTIQLLATR